MFTERQQLINRYMGEIWNRKNCSVIYEVFSEDALIHSPMGEARGPRAVEQAHRQWHEAFPDIRVMLLDIFEMRDKVAVQWNARGTHKGPFLGIPPSNKPIICGGTSIYRLENEKIVEYWAYINLHHVIQQLQSEEPDYSAHLAPL